MLDGWLGGSSHRFSHGERGGASASACVGNVFLLCGMTLTKERETHKVK